MGARQDESQSPTSSVRGVRRPKLSRRSKAPAHIQGLVERVEAAVADARYAPRKEMWTRHNRLEKQPKVPVSVFLHGGYTYTWHELIPPDNLVSRGPLERAIELQLRQKLYRHEHIPDDDVLLPTVWIRSARPQSNATGPGSLGELASNVNPLLRQDADAHATEDTRLWGLPFRRMQTGDAGGAYKVDPVVTSEGDMADLHHPAYEVDADRTRVLFERVTEMVDGRLPVKIETDELGASPSETVVDLMGIEPVLYGVIDNPAFVHKMMEFVTDGYVRYHRQREASGQIDAEESWKYRIHYEALPSDEDSHRLGQSWTYISAQSLSGLSPGMFDEFLQPYHARLAEVLGHQRVYFHGCEDLTRKIPIIRRLPNLRRFHVSPWTNLGTAVDELGQDFVLEVHVHTAETLLVHTPDQMRENLERIMSIAGRSVIDINLSDIETVNGNPSLLTTWAQIAQEVTARHS